VLTTALASAPVPANRHGNFALAYDGLGVRASIRRFSAVLGESEWTRRDAAESPHLAQRCGFRLT
jgi:hypothetical protein